MIQDQRTRSKLSCTHYCITSFCSWWAVRFCQPQSWHFEQLSVSHLLSTQGMWILQKEFTMIDVHGRSTQFRILDHNETYVRGGQFSHFDCSPGTSNILVLIPSHLRMFNASKPLSFLTQRNIYASSSVSKSGNSSSCIACSTVRGTKQARVLICLHASAAVRQ